MILVIPTSKFEEQSKFDDLDIKNFINQEGLYMDRPAAEIDPTYLQIIPYMVVIRDNKEVFTYERLKKGNEARLHSKFSVGIGGHCDQDPFCNTPWECLLFNTTKELFEELIIESNEKILLPKLTKHLIYDPSNDVGKVHLGLLYTVDASGRSVTEGEPDKIKGSFKTFDELKAMPVESFETWTTIALTKLGIL